MRLFWLCLDETDGVLGCIDGGSTDGVDIMKYEKLDQKTIVTDEVTEIYWSMHLSNSSIYYSDFIDPLTL